MTVQRDNLDVAGAEAEVVQEAESVLEGTPVIEPEPVPAPPTEVPRPKKEEDPEVTPMCCGKPPGPMGLIGDVDSGGDVEREHDHDCPNHPDNLAAAEKVS